MSARRPNILFIMDDQHRDDYLGCAGARFVRTPNIDRLATRGVRFENCFVNSPICAPSRIALATGLQPRRMGALENDASLPLLSHRTYYQRLRDAGYWVGCVGKLDLAKSEKFNGSQGNRPAAFAFGFTHPVECEGKMHAGAFATPQGPYGVWLEQQGLYEAFHKDYTRRARAGWVPACEDSVLPAGAFEDAYIGRRAAQWIQEIPDEFPWHLFVSFVGPHDPFDPPAEYAQRYRNAEMPLPIVPAPEGKPARQKPRHEMTLDKTLECRRQYCAAVELIDDQVGHIVTALNQRGWADNTYIIFTSDHGEMLGDHGLWTKNQAYEAAIHVPLIVTGPGIAPGQRASAMVELIDLNATICDLAGLMPQEGIDAWSFRPVLEGLRTEHRDNVISCIESFACLRDRRYKVVRNINDVTEFYDLQEDPQELRNLFPERSQETGALLKLLRSRLTEGGNSR